MRIISRKFWKILRIFRKRIILFEKIFTTQNWNFGVWHPFSPHPPFLSFLPPRLERRLAVLLAAAPPQFKKTWHFGSGGVGEIDPLARSKVMPKKLLLPVHLQDFRECRWASLGRNLKKKYLSKSLLLSWDVRSGCSTRTAREFVVFN